MPGSARFAAMARAADRLVRGLPVRIDPVVAELVSRAGGRLLALSDRRLGHGAEARIRGVLGAQAFGAGRLRIGRNVRIVSPENVQLEDGVALADNVFLSASGPRGRIAIGGDTHVDVGTVLYGQGGLRVGRGCAIASGVAIYSQSNQYREAPAGRILEQSTVYSAVEVGEDVWIGAHAVVLPGVVVGDHAVIGAGAVVTRAVPAWAVVAGVPAKVVRDRREA